MPNQTTPITEPKPQMPNAPLPISTFDRWKPIMPYIVIGLVISGGVGYFVGKKYGIGYGIGAGIGTAVVLFGTTWAILLYNSFHKPSQVQGPF